MLAVGRGLMSLPKLMMFDEPSLGLAPILVQEIFAMIKQIKEEGVTIMLVEQNVTQTLAMCDRAYVLENGRIVLEGTLELTVDNQVYQLETGDSFYFQSSRQHGYQNKGSVDTVLIWVISPPTF
jgi:branched-chain amino acid transport system ATP-binding protein